MDKKGLFFFTGGVAAFLFYLLLILLLILFFNDYKRSKRYVPKSTQSIEISLTQALPVRTKPKPVAKKEQKEKQKSEIPAVAKKSSATAKHPAKPKPKAIASLFKGVKIKEPTEQTRAARLANAPKIKYKAASKEEKREQKKAQQLIRDINLSKPSIRMTSKASGQGEVDAYMSKLYEILYGSWQPEAIYAGSAATVRLLIEPDGKFDYTLLYPSDNQGFNQSLIEYLEQLKQKRFPSHKRNKRLVIDVEFKAKE
ncbi:TonB C-terminal domain-containing protein [Hydrogenimonas urashimensis]|uniref:TonB C-terminal domain-containing protein n=1 Tax=Hydrogenimonas urashimensis TaxID=2740515 RepID=UPI0019169B8F|nr:TonB C-terminal domain-containing protein [Hydrogenimonas urashimensis]